MRSVKDEAVDKRDVLRVPWHGFVVGGLARQLDGGAVPRREHDVERVRRHGDAGFRQVDRLFHEIHRPDVEVLQQGGERDEAHVLDEPVAHARPLAGAERDKVLGLDDFTLLDEARRVEFERLVAPVVGADVELVVVQEDDGAGLDVVTCAMEARGARLKCDNPTRPDE